MFIPKDVLDVIETLESAGYEAWVVGGCVRDSLLGRNPKDYDVASSCPPSDVTKLFSRCVNTGAAYGTVTVLTPSIPVEVTVFRTESVYSDNRHPDIVVPANDIETDLSRRDFTINAMAWHPVRKLCDPYDGQSDLIHQTVKTVGDPYTRFSEDALRILRCLRFASVLDFNIDTATLEAVRFLSPSLSRISAERINTELIKLLTGVRPELISETVTSGGLSLFGITNISRPFLLRKIPTKPILRLTALLWLSLNNVSVTNVTGLLKALRMDNAAIYKVNCLIRAISTPVPADLISLKQTFCNIPPKIWREALSIRAVLLEENTDGIEEMLKQTAGEPWNRSMLSVDGSDIAVLGFQGKAIGRVLTILLEHVLKDPSLNTHKSLMAIAEKLVEKMPPEPNQKSNSPESCKK